MVHPQVVVISVLQLVGTHYQIAQIQVVTTLRLVTKLVVKCPLVVIMFYLVMKQEKEIHLELIILMLVILQEDLTKMETVISQSVDMQTTVPRQVLKT